LYLISPRLFHLAKDLCNRLPLLFRRSAYLVQRTRIRVAPRSMLQSPLCSNPIECEHPDECAAFAILLGRRPQNAALFLTASFLLEVRCSHGVQVRSEARRRAAIFE